MTKNSAVSLKSLKPVRWWHEAIVDDMIAHPTDTLKVRAARLNYSVPYLSIIINSDAFKALYEERRRDFTERLQNGISQKTAEAANKALDIVLETLEKKRDKLPFEALSEFTDRTLERLGYGVKHNSPAPNVNVNVVAGQVTPEQLADARKALRAAEAGRVIEHEPVKQLPSEPIASSRKEGV